MTMIGVIIQKGDRTPYIYALCESFERADSIMKTKFLSPLHDKSSTMWIRTVDDNSLIGDQI